MKTFATIRLLFGGLGVAIALGGMMSPSRGGTASTPIGAVDKLQAAAEASLGHETRDLAVDGPLFYHDRLHTGSGARLEAKLADDTVITLGANARLTIDEFVYKPGEPGSKLAMAVSSGAFLFVGGRIEGPTGGNVAIRTPIGTLGVRGTTVWGGPIDHGYGVLVLKGDVTVTTPNGQVSLHEGQGTMIRARNAPDAAAPWPEDRVQRAVATISFHN